MTAVLYGIKNCDTVKKARAWLDAHRIEYRFHDFRSDGIDVKQTQNWLSELSLDELINKRGTTWRQLDEKTRNSLTASNAAALIVVHPTLIKRPLLDIGHQRFVGFSDSMYRDIFKAHTL
ncbi:MAG: ArsC family reductase [Spongiibacteraceae bacterium]